MNKVLKKVLGFASASVLTAVMVLAVSPVQASDVDARIQALERELVQLKQNQEATEERTLAAEMKGPSFKYAAGKGLTIAAADNNWSITFKNRLQLYSTFWLSQDDPESGAQNGQMTVRRFHPSINATSQQGFYDVRWIVSPAAQGAATTIGSVVGFDGDLWLHFEKTNPWLPAVGYGFNPSFKGNREAGFGRTEGSMMTIPGNVALGGAVDRGLILSWTKLPAMGTSKITHFELGVGHDELDEYVRWVGNKRPLDGGTTPALQNDGRSYHLSFGIKPLGNSKGMGGVDVSSVTYSLTYVTLGDGYPKGAGARAATTVKRIRLISTGTVYGEHTYVAHGLRWSPVKWLTLSAHYGDYEANGQGDDAAKATDGKETRIAAQVWLWGPKSGMMGGSKKEGGISFSPMYNSTEYDWTGGKTAEATNYGLAVVYNVPGGWMQIHGVWDNMGCESATDSCSGALRAVAEDGEDNFNTFTLVAEYKF